MAVGNCTFSLAVHEYRSAGCRNCDSSPPPFPTHHPHGDFNALYKDRAGLPLMEPLNALAGGRDRSTCDGLGANFPLSHWIWPPRGIARR